MVDTRTWALIAGGFAAGGAVIGAAVWRTRRVLLRPLGRIYKIAGRYYADAAVVEELLRRVPGAEPWGEDQGGRLYLFQRGRVEFRPTAVRPPFPGHLYEIVATHASVEDLVIEWVYLGLALPGQSFPDWPKEQSGRWQPPPEPLHPTAFDYARKYVNLYPRDLPQAPDCSIGHYFKVGEHFYADGKFINTLDGFRGTDFDEDRRRTIVPFWRRGRIELQMESTAKMLPEQVGSLYRIEEHLSSVQLADLLLELEGLSLVYWGGQWPRFPERLPVTPPTGPGWPVVSKPMEERQPALVFELDGFYLNAEALRRIRTRIPLDGDRFVWQSTPLQLVPRGDSVGKLVRVETLSGGHDDDAIRAFIGQLLLHRIVERMELPPDARVNTPPDARVTSGSTSVPEETS
jgi:hypothetical protein